MIAKDHLLGWLKGIDERINRKIILVAVGGTAMTLLGLKPSTRDVDFCIEGKNSKLFKEAIKDSEFKVDLFQDGFIFSEQLPDDYIEKIDGLPYFAKPKTLSDKMIISSYVDVVPRDETMQQISSQVVILVSLDVKI